MVWKLVTSPDTGDATRFGSADMNRISNLFSGVFDSDGIDLNSITKLRNQCLQLANPANTFNYIFNTATIAANINLYLPLLTTDDQLTCDSNTTTIINKTISAASNIISGISDTNISPHTSSKISILAKSQLNSVIAYTDQSNIYSNVGALQQFGNMLLCIANPLNTQNYIVNSSAITANRNITLPLLTADDTWLFANFPAAVTGKTLVLSSNTLTDTGAVSGDVLAFDGARYSRFAKGTANQFLGMDGTGTNLIWGNPATVAADLSKTIQYPEIRKCGAWYGTSIGWTAGGNIIGTSGSGMLAGEVSSLDPTNQTNAKSITSAGNRLQITTNNAVGAVGGWKTLGVITERDLNPRIKAKFKLNSITNVRLWIGLDSDSAGSHNTATADPFASMHVFEFCLQNNGSTFQIAHNNGGGSTVFTDTLVTADTADHTIEIKAVNSVPKWQYSIDGSVFTDINSVIPDASTDLYLYLGIDNRNASAPSVFHLYYAEIDHDA